MSGPVHFDIAALRAGYKAANAEAVAQARAAAKSEAALRSIDLQERFLPLMIEASVIVAEARNDGFDEFSISKAFDHVMGNSIGNYLANMARRGRPDCCLVTFESFRSMMDAASSGVSTISGMSSAEFNYAGTRGGHA